MPQFIDRETAQRLIANGAQVVEILAAEEYEEEHLPGAINLPLRKIENARAVLNPDRPVIVYCWDPA